MALSTRLIADQPMELASFTLSVDWFDSCSDGELLCSVLRWCDTNQGRYFREGCQGMDPEIAHGVRFQGAFRHLSAAFLPSFRWFVSYWTYFWSNFGAQSWRSCGRARS